MKKREPRDGTIWISILKQMDAAKAPSPGMCAICNKKPARAFHTQCEPCRIASGGYAFAHASTFRG